MTTLSRQYLKTIFCSSISILSMLFACSCSSTSPDLPRHGDLSARDSEILHDAEQILLRECMREAGFDYWPVPFEPIADSREFPYVLDDVAWARRHGYGSDIEKQKEEVRETDPNRRYSASLSPERRAAKLVVANGSRPEGITAITPDGSRMKRSDKSCLTSTETSLYGDAQVWFQVEVTVMTLTEMRHEMTLADPRFAAATVPWSECMKLAGFSYKNPADARDNALSDTSGEVLEKRVATAEAECAHRTGLVVAASAIDREHGNALRERFQSDVDTNCRMKWDALPLARKIVEGA